MADWTVPVASVLGALGGGGIVQAVLTYRAARRKAPIEASTAIVTAANANSEMALSIATRLEARVVVLEAEVLALTADRREWQSERRAWVAWATTLREQWATIRQHDTPPPPPDSFTSKDDPPNKGVIWK